MNCEDLKKAGGCPVPWSELSSKTTGTWRMCCYQTVPFSDMTINTHTPREVMESERLNKIRAAMMSGNKNLYMPFCDRCFVMEERGQVSRREKRWDIVSEETKRCMELTQEDGKLPFINYELFDIKFTGNKCNLRCYMCDADHSSNLANERKKLGWHSGPIHLNPFKDMDDKQRYDWWEGFIEAMPFIKVINLTTLNYRGKSLRDFFPKFKEIHLQVSLDGYGEQYDWVRYPASYDAVIENLKQVMGIDNVELQISITISALTIEALPKLYDHMKELGVELRFDNVLYHPHYLQVSSLPLVIKDRLRPVLENRGFDDLVKLLYVPENLQHWKQLVDYLDALDGHRGTDWRKTFPLVGVDIV
jgi:hypothetical protein